MGSVCCIARSCMLTLLHGLQKVSHVALQLDHRHGDGQRCDVQHCIACTYF